jgi:tRNA threonylcarbamoyladenosine biosynthesis protein TsaE
MVNSALPQLKIEICGLEELESAASEVIKFAGDLKFWILAGDMGAGKTTFIKAVCKCLGVTDNVTSPTYSIINEYETEGGEPIYHFDFYRMKEESEALDIGVDEYFDSGKYCFVEWPSKIPTLLPDSHFLKVSISLTRNDNRLIELNRHD